MLQYPNDTVVVMNRGNHECMTMNGSRCGGFQYELLEKYGSTWGPALHSLFGQLFSLLPLASVIQSTVVVLHGGVGRDPETQLQSLKDCPDSDEYQDEYFLTPLVLASCNLSVSNALTSETAAASCNNG